VTRNSDALRLAELLCARLCHDLAGPTGALLGILEYVRAQQPASDEAAMAEETAADLAQRLKLLRGAWAQTSEGLNLKGLSILGATVAAGRKFRLVLDGLDRDIALSPDASRVVLNLLLLASESLPGGGTLSLSSAGRANILVTISGSRAGWPTGLATWLADESAAWDAALSGARNIQGPLTALLVRDRGFRLSMMMPAGASDEMDRAPPLLLDLSNG
jgi:histidine phosphotransferase ChpT